MQDLMFAEEPVEKREQLLRDNYTKSTFTGKAAYSEIFENFHINDEKTGWIPAKLGQFLRLNRAVFDKKEENMKLVSALKNFTANAKSEIEKQRDPSGSRADVYRTQVESNLPKDFTVNIAIFKGTEKTPIVVEFDHYLSDGEVYLQLVSPGAKEVAEEYRDRCIDDVSTPQSMSSCIGSSSVQPDNATSSLSVYGALLGFTNIPRWELSHI